MKKKRISDATNFNSHTREAVTQHRYYSHEIAQNFNSHTREGVTWFMQPVEVLYDFSTHTPVRV